MINSILKQAFLLGIVFCIGMIQMSSVVEAENENDISTETIIPTPQNGYTIVLRAPTSEHRHIVLLSDDKNSKPHPKFTVSLPKNTPICFRVDQVNTALYNITIKIDQKAIEKNNVNPFKDFPEFGAIFKMVSKFPTYTSKDSKIKTIEEEMKALVSLNNQLDSLLYKPETSGFYSSKSMNKFKEIQEDAAKSAHENLKLKTAREIRMRKTINLNSLYQDVDVKNSSSTEYNLKDLTDFYIQIAEAYDITADKLQAIEDAVWFKQDHQILTLKDEIIYTCTIESKDNKSKVEPQTYVVTVKGYPTGWLIKWSQGPFISNLINESYYLKPEKVEENVEGTTVTSIKNKIQQADLYSKDNVSLSSGILIHVYHSRFKIFGISGGLGLDGNKNPQVVIAPSLIFNIDENRFLTFSVGSILGKVSRLDGYKVNDTFMDSKIPTKMVNRLGYFGALTFNFNSLFGQ